MILLEAWKLHAEPTNPKYLEGPRAKRRKKGTIIMIEIIVEIISRQLCKYLLYGSPWDFQTAF
jgi:hypothetical protein